MSKFSNWIQAQNFHTRTFSREDKHLKMSWWLSAWKYILVHLHYVFLYNCVCVTKVLFVWCTKQSFVSSCKCQVLKCHLVVCHNVTDKLIKAWRKHGKFNEKQTIDLKKTRNWHRVNVVSCERKNVSQVVLVIQIYQLVVLMMIILLYVFAYLLFFFFIKSLIIRIMLMKTCLSFGLC